MHEHGFGKLTTSFFVFRKAKEGENLSRIKFSTALNHLFHRLHLPVIFEFCSVILHFDF